MSESNGLIPGRISLLKLHALVFALGVILIAYSVVSTITYPGNAGVDFAVFRPLIIERGNLLILWSLLFVLHLAGNQVWTTAQRRERAALMQAAGRETVESRLRDRVKTKRQDPDSFYDDDEDIARLSDLL